MTAIFPSRYTATSEEPFVVFLIGLRINRLLAFRKWMRVAAAMPAMLAELRSDPALGLLRVENFVYWRGGALAQYWKSFDHLHAYAHARDGAHYPAWAEFNRLVGSDGSVGIWHETYRVSPGQFECVYANMPRFGLAGAVQHLPTSGRLQSARSRMEQTSEKEPNPDQNL